MFTTWRCPSSTVCDWFPSSGSLDVLYSTYLIIFSMSLPVATRKILRNTSSYSHCFPQHDPMCRVTVQTMFKARHPVLIGKLYGFENSRGIYEAYPWSSELFLDMDTFEELESFFVWYITCSSSFSGGCSDIEHWCDIFPEDFRGPVRHQPQ